jgi:P4 family phage/plasmid primase-like protien
MSDTPSNPAGAIDAGPLQSLYALLGGKPVLLPLPKGEKGPAFSGWQKVSYAQTQKRGLVTEYRKALPGEELETGKKTVPRGPARPYHDLLVERAAAGNIGVVLGEASVLEQDGRTWHLCSIDIDDAAGAEAFVAENPKLAFTLQTCGARGRNLWVWIEGLYPKLHKDLCWLALEDHESRRVPGRWVKKGEPDPDAPFGEWRSTGGQTVICGTHPTGKAYEMLVRNPPVRITFDEINWPKGLHLPWAKPELPPDEQAEEDARVKLFEELFATYGQPWGETDSGAITLNQPFFAGLYAKRHRILYSPEEARFWRYHGDDTGLWVKQTEDSIRAELAADIKEVADDNHKPAMMLLRTTALMGAITGMLRGQVEKWEAFKRATSPKTQRPRALIHCKNAMLDLDESPPRQAAFGEQYMSRQQLAVALREGAECPRFLGELLGPAVAPDDIELMQKFAGQMLIGVNYAQKLLILTGTAGGGKTTFVNVIAAIIGEMNVGQLRTEHLHERFEIFRMIGKSLLTGVDVPGKFLQSEGAYVIKGLCGGDLMDAEAKQGNDTFQVRGEFNILITCNSRLKVRLDGDSAAWRRRICIVPYENKPPERPDPHFVRKLVASEGSGILNWMIAGAISLMKDLDETGTIRQTAKQKDRVESLLAESDSVRDFVRRGLTKAPSEAKVTTEQLVQAYVRYCEHRGWSAESVKVVERELPDALLEIHRAHKANDIKVDGAEKAARGYRGIQILPIGDDQAQEGSRDELV